MQLHMYHMEKYGIPITIRGDEGETQTNIYLDEPLRKVGNYADYIDFREKKVVRYVKELIFDGNTDWTQYKSANWRGFMVYCSKLSGNPSRLENISNYFGHYKGNVTPSYPHLWLGVGNPFVYLPWRKDSDKTPASWYDAEEDQSVIDGIKNSLANNNLEIYYTTRSSTEESISLPNIQFNKGTNILSVGTEIAPSKIEVDYLIEKQ